MEYRPLTLREIQARREAIRAELRSLLEAHPDGVFPADAEQRSTDLETEATRLADMERRQQALDDLDRRAAGTPLDQNRRETRGTAPDLQAGEVVGLRPEQRMAEYVGLSEDPLSLGRMIRGHLLGDWSGALAERRAMGEATGASGGFFVNDTLSAQTIDLVRNQTVVVRAGALTIPVGAGTTTFVRVLSDPTAQWRKEGQTINETEGSYEPTTVKPVSLAALVRVSVELLDDVPLFAGMIESQIASALALELDRVGLFGTGAASEPLGLYNVTGPSDISMGTNGAALTDYDEWLDAIANLETINANPRTTVYSPRTKRALSGLVTGIASDKTKLAPPAEFTAMQRLVSNQVRNNLVHGSATNASVAFVGDFSQMGVAVRSSLVIEASRSAGDTFAKGQVLVRAMMRADIAHMRPTHFARIKGIIP
jgi:HK97 family phage major capsid protein